MEDDEVKVSLPWTLRIILVLGLLALLYDDPSRILRMIGIRV